MKSKNLISLRERSSEERTEIARKGGIASGVSRREKKTIKSYLLSVLDEKEITYKPFLPLIDEDNDLNPFPTEERTYKAKIAYALLQKAMDGDLKAIDMILKMTNEPEK